MECRLSIKRILIDGTILSVLLSILIYGSLYVDPLMWVGDYPPDIQAAVGAVDVPLDRNIIVGLLFLGVIVGVGVTVGVGVIVTVGVGVGSGCTTDANTTGGSPASSVTSTAELLTVNGRGIHDPF